MRLHSVSEMLASIHYENRNIYSTENKTIRGAQAAEGGLQGTSACSGPRGSCSRSTATQLGARKGLNIQENRERENL